MNTAAADRIAKAVLYEGYMLYPYRPSAVKNQQRFNFGVLYPRAFSEAQFQASSGDFMNLVCKARATPCSSAKSNGMKPPAHRYRLRFLGFGMSYAGCDFAQIDGTKRSSNLN